MAVTTKRIDWRILTGCGLVALIAAHGLAVWGGLKLSGQIGGWLPWIAGGALLIFGLKLMLMALGLHHGIRRFHGKNHDHPHPSEEAERGPHDGFLVNLGHGFVEITIFENNTSPRFRLFFHNQRKQARSVPARAIVKIETERPDGARQTFAFSPKGEYLESTDGIPKPHEFKAIVQVSHGSHQHPPHTVQF